MLPAPYVALQQTALGWGASVGFRLVELQSERLPEEMSAASRAQRLAETHERSARLAELIAGWPRPASVELHLISVPSLDAQKAPGQVEIALRLTALESDREQALARCLSDYVALRPILGAFWPHGYFAPLLTKEDFRKLFSPFVPRSALCIERRRAEIRLSEPFRWSSGRLGFQGEPRVPPEPTVVRQLLPWVPAVDDWSALLEALLDFPAPQWVVTRLVTPSDPEPHMEQLRTTLRTCEHFLAGAPSDQVTLAVQADQIRQLCLRRLSQLAAHALRVGVILFAPGDADKLVVRILGQSISSDPVRGADAGPFAGGFSVDTCDIKQAMSAFYTCRDEPFTVDEAACALRLPLVFGENDLGLPVRRSRTVRAALPPMQDGESVTVLAVNRHRGQERPIRVPLEHRFKHIFALGMTGTGKSTFMLSLLSQDLRQGHGVCLIDPHGDLADDLLARFPEQREKDLIVVDLTDRQRIVPMNFLRWQTPEQRDLIVDDLYATLDRIYDFHETGGPIFEQNFRSVLKLLMGDLTDGDRVFTLLELPLLYQSSDFRRYLVSRNRDQQLKDFVEELEQVRGENSLNNLAPYVTSKFTRFLQDQLLRYVVGHGDMKLDFASILNEQKVLIVKLGRGRFGAQAAELLLGMFMSRFRSALMARAEIPNERRAPFFLYVDEMGSLAQDENFSRVLSEARKYRLGLVLATQYARQLGSRESRESTLSAVLGNAGTVISFRVGVEDAPLVAPLFGPHLTAQDLIELPNFEGYMRLHMDRKVVRPFNIYVQRPVEPARMGRAELLVEISRRSWGVPPEECEKRISERRCFALNCKLQGAGGQGAPSVGHAADTNLTNVEEDNDHDSQVCLLQIGDPASQSVLLRSMRVVGVRRLRRMGRPPWWRLVSAVRKTIRSTRVLIKRLVLSKTRKMAC